MEHRDEIKRIANYYGVKSQVRQMQEECGELIVAISHYIRGRKYAEAELFGELADVRIMLEQLADVRIMLEQLEYLFEKDKNILDEYYEFKILRELERIEDRNTANE